VLYLKAPRERSAARPSHAVPKKNPRSGARPEAARQAAADAAGARRPAKKPVTKTPAAKAPATGTRPENARPAKAPATGTRPAKARPAKARPAKAPARARPAKARPAQPRDPAGYSGKPLAKKLGIKPGMSVALVSAPAGFSVEGLPDGARLRRGARGRPALVIWFVGSRLELGWEIRRIAGFAAGAPLWIAWRKQAARGGRAAAGSGEPPESAVREAGLEAGLVDYKVCAIDEEWSGLLFAPRRGTDAHLKSRTKRALM